jgi:hypothetical protein
MEFYAMQNSLEEPNWTEDIPSTSSEQRSSDLTDLSGRGLLPSRTNPGAIKRSGRLAPYPAGTGGSFHEHKGDDSPQTE